MEHSRQAHNYLYVCRFCLTTHFCTQVSLMVTMVTCIRHPFLMSSKSPVFLKQICLKIRECVPVVLCSKACGADVNVRLIVFLQTHAFRRSAKRETQAPPPLLNNLTFYYPLYTSSPVNTVLGHLNPFWSTYFVFICRVFNGFSRIRGEEKRKRRWKKIGEKGRNRK